MILLINLYMPPLAHYFNGGMMMLLEDGCGVTYKILEITLIQSFFSMSDTVLLGC